MSRPKETSATCEFVRVKQTRFLLGMNEKSASGLSVTCPDCHDHGHKIIHHVMPPSANMVRMKGVDLEQ